MDIASLAIKLFIGLALGAVIGLEREVHEKRKHHETIKPTALFGLRSFSLITVLGVIVGALYPQLPGIALLIAGAYFVLLLIAYVLDSKQSQDPGITTELAMIFSFVIGILLTVSFFPIQLTIALTIVLILLLSQKEQIKNVVENIRSHEINAFVSFAIIALVILPFLPNTTYAITDIPGTREFFKNIGLDDIKLFSVDLLNPFKLWLIVVLVIGVDLIGYVLERTIGTKKGWLLASAAGGFVSSTATTQSLAQESKNTQRINPLVSAAILANIVSFIQIAILISFVNSMFFIKLLPILAFMMLAGTSLLIYFLYRDSTDTQKTHTAADEKKDDEKIIDISAAVKFALFFLAVSVLSKITLALYGNSGFFIATGIGAFLGLDAVMINTAELAGGNIDYQVAIVAFILANTVNLFAKSFYSYVMGKREFAVKFFISVCIIITTSLFALLFT